ncbi:MAG: hypothetical protein IPP71_08085 [Bacteroidetes bacterium]|nr:hypothetical protein [Bacteroidota bacterium]
MSLENFSGKDDEALRIENELLKLKIMAEHGAKMWFASPARMSLLKLKIGC